jgi:hypothetical protein
VEWAECTNLNSIPAKKDPKETGVQKGSLSFSLDGVVMRLRRLSVFYSIRIWGHILLDIYLMHPGICLDLYKIFIYYIIEILRDLFWVR